MKYSGASTANTDDLVAIYIDAFAAAEGSEEGEVIGALVRNLLETTPEEDIFVFCASTDSGPTGSIIFSRMTFAQDDRTVFILSPVAVAPGHQGQGVGQGLLTYGLNALRAQGVDIAITYGDPAYYEKVGFAPITEDVAAAPLILSQPEGWLAQSLSDQPLTPLKGASRCVKALDNQAYW